MGMLMFRSRFYAAAVSLFVVHHLVAVERLSSRVCSHTRGEAKRAPTFALCYHSLTDFARMCGCQLDLPFRHLHSVLPFLNRISKNGRGAVL